MTALADLIKVVTEESFTPEMAEMGKSAAVELSALQARLRELEDFVIGVEETLELHPSHWLLHLTNDIAEVKHK